MMFAEHQLGNPLAEMARARSDLAQASDECGELEAQLEKAQARRDRARSNVEFFARRMQASADLAQRSSPAGLGDLAARVDEVRREEAARHRVEARLAARPRSQATATLSARSSTPSASPPKAPCTESTGDYWEPCPAHGGVNHGREAERGTVAYRAGPDVGPGMLSRETGTGFVIR
jgi:hypothetical protein